MDRFVTPTIEAPLLLCLACADRMRPGARGWVCRSCGTTSGR